MTTDELVAVSQDQNREIGDRTATKQFLIIWILFDRQINVAEWNIETPASQN